jgi:hypothetical protein
VRSIDGDHSRALADLDRLWPMVRLASYEHPALRYDYLNSLAVELAETGRFEEAKHAVEIALRSPFSDRYPNWRATRDEITDKERELSYRPRLLSLAGGLLLAPPAIPKSTISDPSQLETSEGRRHDLCFEVQELSPNGAPGPDLESRPLSSKDDAAFPRDIPEEARRPGAGRRKPLTLLSSFIDWRITLSKTEAEAAIPSLITILQPALAPNSRKSLKTAPECAALRAAPAYSRISENSASCCDSGGDPPDDVRRVDGYPKSPLARGPPATPIKS